MFTKYKIVPFFPYHFVRTILSNTILSVYHFVHTILSVPFCPLPFCPVTVCVCVCVCARAFVCRCLFVECLVRGVFVHAYSTVCTGVCLSVCVCVCVCAHERQSGLKTGCVGLGLKIWDVVGPKFNRRRHIHV